MKKLLAVFLIFYFISAYAQQYISVSSKTADELVRDVFIGTQNANCITVSNVTVNGWQSYGNNPFSFGYFEKGTLPFEIEKGIILSTGSVFKAPGPNSNTLSDGSGPIWLGDNDLENSIPAARPSVNATSLEFDFTTSQTTGISFEYMFLSEESYEGNCSYSDAFAFLIKKKGSTDDYENIALVPGTLDPVNTKTINGSANCLKNTDYFGGFNNGNGGVDSPTNYNGQTKVLTAKKDNIIPGETYHIKLVIADQQNYQFDSAVFLKAGSFVGKKDLGPDLLLGTNNSICEGGTKLLDATTTNGTNYKWFKDGVNIPGTNNNPKYTVTSGGIYDVTFQVGGCQLKGSIKVEFGEIPLFFTNLSFCNYKEGNPITINLQDLNPQIISNLKDYFKVRYFEDAAHLIALPNEFTYSNDVTIYMVIESGSCVPVEKTINLNTPKKSTLLLDQVICSNSTTRLEAETGFKYYRFKRENGDVIAEGITTNFVDGITVGKYFVELTSFNGCTLEQEVNITASTGLQITNIEVNGSTATIFVTGGNPPYEYSLDNINFQDSNIFINIPRGLRKIYVRDKQNCETVFKEFLIINLINVITPNGDGKNDVLDYSDLSIKKEVQFEIYDRFGTLVFKSENQSFIWNGKLNGRTLPTGTYYYILNWTEPDTNIPVSYKGWILLKNRN